MVPERFVGIDVGQRALHAVALTDRGGGRLRVAGGEVFSPEELDDVVAWCVGARVAVDAPLGPATVGEDAHPAVSRKFRLARCAEVELGVRHGIWVPWAAPREAPAAGWMAVGFALADALIAAGHDVLETYPHGVFRRLAGTRRPALPKKTTVDGLRARVSLLSEAGVDGITALWSHDAVDAAACAIVARDQVHGRAEAVTCGHDRSVMHLPSP